MFWAESGAADDGLIATVLPASIAADDGPVASAIGKLNGLTTANTPWGRRMERVWTARPEVAHRVVVAVVVLHGLGVVADEIGRLLHFPSASMRFLPTS